MRALVVAATFAVAAPAATSALEVLSAFPAPSSLAAPVDGRITVTFDRPIDRTSVTATSFWAFGRWSGVVDGTLRLSSDGLALTLEPDRRLSAGETVMVVLSRDLRGLDGTHLRPGGYSYQFWTQSRGAGFDFTEIDRFSTRSAPEVSSRAYGGFGSDLNGDGFLDLTIVNEDTDDLRVFLNRGDHSGRFKRFLRPTTPVGNVPSPSEPSDFNRDGLVDVAVANTQDETVSILLGNGDGTFAPAESVFVGGEPRGIAVLDADGDGDVDVAATSFELGRVTVLENDGLGSFNEGTSFGSGTGTGNRGERAITAADMNNDGLLDLVVGLLIAQEVEVWTSNGDGSFALSGSQASGGETWMLAAGDLDRNRTEDIVVVNSETDNAAVLMGDGSGGLAEPRTTSTDRFPLATDLADLDGDGDLDWVTSSFFGNWLLFENDGNGSFALERTFAAPRAASCSLPMDLDNDGVLDLVLVDELEDEIVLMRSRAVIFASDFEGGDTTDWSKTKGSVRVVQPGLSGSGHALEVTADGSRSFVERRWPPGLEASLKVSFELDPRNVDLAGEVVEVLRFEGGGRALDMTLERSRKRYRLRLMARNGGKRSEIGSTRIRADRRAELRIEWSSASADDRTDGRAALFKKGKLKAQGPLANGNETISRIRLGLPRGSSSAASGAFLIDRVTVTR